MHGGEIEGTKEGNPRGAEGGTQTPERGTPENPRGYLRRCIWTPRLFLPLLWHCNIQVRPFFESKFLKFGDNPWQDGNIEKSSIEVAFLRMKSKFELSFD